MKTARLPVEPDETPLLPVLQQYRALCEETLDLYLREHQALHQGGEYQPFQFYRHRKDLLPRLEAALTELRRWRGLHRSGATRPRAPSTELRRITDQVQTMLMRILQLDRENQQALLRRGLLPARHLPPAAAQQPHFVADLYRRHSPA
ncbi:MAG: hypothetical protein WHT82_06420 [Limisphaera sp.]